MPVINQSQPQPVPQTQKTAYKSSPAPSWSSSSGPRIATFGSLREDDAPKPGTQNFYSGGEKSGIAVQVGAHITHKGTHRDSEMERERERAREREKERQRERETERGRKRKRDRERGARGGRSMQHGVRQTSFQLLPHIALLPHFYTIISPPPPLDQYCPVLRSRTRYGQSCRTGLRNADGAAVCSTATLAYRCCTFPLCIRAAMAKGPCRS